MGKISRRITFLFGCNSVIDGTASGPAGFADMRRSCATARHIAYCLLWLPIGGWLTFCGGIAAADTSFFPMQDDAKAGRISEEYQVVQSKDAAAGILYPVQRQQSPKFLVGDVMPKDRTEHPYFPGLDLPRLGNGDAYVRTDEFIYRIDSKTRIIREVVPIATVILR